MGHKNGNICLNATRPRCAQSYLETLVGPYPSKVDSLAFAIRHPDDVPTDAVPSCSELRLFSSGGGSELLEWDMNRGCVRVRMPSLPLTLF